MNRIDFKSQWSGSPLVVASADLLKNAALPGECRDFLATVGLPSNALWFDRSSTAIMCFDSVACLRQLGKTDLSLRAWKGIAPMGKLTILGVRSMTFVVSDENGRLLMIHSDTHMRVPIDPEWKASIFVNQGPSHFASCLIAYKAMRQIFEQEAYNFDSPAIRGAVTDFRDSVQAIDARALVSADHYWAQILDHLDVW